MVSSLPELVACSRPPSHSTRPQSTGHYDCFIRLLPQNPEPHILPASPFLLFKLLPDPSPSGTRAQPLPHSRISQVETGHLGSVLTLLVQLHTLPGVQSPLRPGPLPLAGG